MKKVEALAALAAMSLLLAGCADDWKVEIDSNTSWHGEVGGRTLNGGLSAKTISGEGDDTFDLPDGDRVCCVVEKLTEEGYLKVKIVNKGGWLLSGDGEADETKAPYGSVTVCAESQQ